MPITPKVILFKAVKLFDLNLSLSLGGTYYHTKKNRHGRRFPLLIVDEPYSFISFRTILSPSFFCNEIK